MTTDASAVAAASVLWVVTILAFYVWTSIALAAVFRKSGEQGWKAWVPVYNHVVLFQLAGLSGWLVLLYLVPIAGWIVLIVACYRISLAFGFGAGMTVVGALLFPVWASILGFGSSRWVGREGGGPRRSAPIDDTTGSSGIPGIPSSRSSAAAAAPAPAAPAVAGPPPAPASQPPYTPVAPPPAYGRGTTPPAPASAGVVPPPGGWAPPPLPVPASSSPPAAAAADAAAEADDDWEGLAFPVGSLDTDEVTGAVTGAPAPISALPFAAEPAVTRTPTAAPVVSAPTGPVRAPDPGDEDDVDEVEPLGDVPGPVRGVGAVGEPWAPARSPMPEADAFADTSGPVSAVAGAPDAGGPRSARSSVSAQSRRPEIPEDPFEETIIARRKRTEWSLIPPSGDPVPLGADVVLLGRRPVADAAHPGAQLIAIDDGTVSKTHARLELRDDVWFVTDLDSTNGIVFATVLGTEVEATPGVEIEAGDRFLIGDAEIRLVRGGQ